MSCDWWCWLRDGGDGCHAFGMHDTRDTERLPSGTRPPQSTWEDTRSTPGDDEGTRLAGPPGRIPVPDRPRRRFRPLAWLRAILLLLVLAIPMLVLLVAGAVYWQARTDEARPVDAIVVLGAAQYNGRPSPVLSARLDHALSLFDDGLAPLIVLTGGRALGDAYTEAETGQSYLEERGVPASAMLLENEGRDTFSSMQGVAALLDGSDVDRILLVSDGFHLLRAELMARHFGFEAYGSAAPDGPIEPWSGSEFAYVIRETGGVIFQAPDWLL